MSATIVEVKDDATFAFYKVGSMLCRFSTACDASSPSNLMCCCASHLQACIKDFNGNHCLIHHEGGYVLRNADRLAVFVSQTSCLRMSPAGRPTSGLTRAKCVSLYQTMILSPLIPKLVML